MIIALQTADATTRVWLYPATPPAGIKPVGELTWESGRQLSDQLLSRLVQFLKEHRFSLQDLTGIAVFSGPGSFTSLRIGHTVANALADSLHIPVAGATGDDWVQAAITVLAHTPAGRPTLPDYGSEAHITRPKT